MKKSGMKKWVTSRIFNKDNKFVIANWLEYESQKAYERCNQIFEQHVAENRDDLSKHTVKFQSYRGIVIFEHSWSNLSDKTRYSYFFLENENLNRH